MFSMLQLKAVVGQGDKISYCPLNLHAKVPGRYRKKDLNPDANIENVEQLHLHGCSLGLLLFYFTQRSCRCVCTVSSGWCLESANICYCLINFRLLYLGGKIKVTCSAANNDADDDKEMPDDQLLTKVLSLLPSFTYSSPITRLVWVTTEPGSALLLHSLLPNPSVTY